MAIWPRQIDSSIPLTAAVRSLILPLPFPQIPNFSLTEKRLLIYNTAVNRQASSNHSSLRLKMTRAHFFFGKIFGSCKKSPKHVRERTITMADLENDTSRSLERIWRKNSEILEGHKNILWNCECQPFRQNARKVRRWLLVLNISMIFRNNFAEFLSTTHFHLHFFQE